MIIRKALQFLRERGLVYTMKASLIGVIGRLEQRGFARFDRTHGTETIGHIQWDNLKSLYHVDQEAGVGYRSANMRIVKHALNSLPIDYKDYIFLDFGSGKGSVLLFASDFPFKKIIGIEIFEALHCVAQKNISIYTGSQQKCQSVSSLCMDALEYEMPHEPLVCFLFNPFPKEIIKMWLENVRRSFAEHPRPIWIIYLRPLASSFLDECGFLSLKSRYITPIYGQWSYVIYSTE
jgi:hypothetical protein